MTNSSRVSTDLARLRRETESFLSTVDSLSEAELAAPSLCEGWDLSLIHISEPTRPY